MVDVDFYLNYLHKRDREPIFDIIKWRYIYAKNLNNYNVYENKLLLEVKTNNRNKIFIEIFFIGKKSVLIRAYPKYPGEFIKKPYMEKIYLEDVRPEMRLEENRIYFSSGEIIGKPDLPPLWSFGLWMSRCMYRNREQVVNVARKLREYGIPCDVINIDPLWIKDKKILYF